MCYNADDANEISLSFIGCTIVINFLDTQRMGNYFDKLAQHF